MLVRMHDAERISATFEGVVLIGKSALVSRPYAVYRDGVVPNLMLQSLFDYPWFLAVGLFFPLFIALELGWQLSWRTQVNSDTDNHEQSGNCAMRCFCF